MQVFRQTDNGSAALVGWGVRVMLLSPNGGEGSGRLADRIAGFGGMVETEADIFAAVETLQSDSIGHGLFVMECDPFGGIEAGRRAVAMMGRAAERTRTILISREVATQIFPEDFARPIQLRSPVTPVSLRLGFEHALRDRLVYMAA